MHTDARAGNPDDYKVDHAIPGEHTAVSKKRHPTATRESSRRKVMGVDTEAQSIAFVCDASASMDAAFSDVRRELTAAVESLGPGHSFSLLFFRDGHTLGLREGAAVEANAAAKREALAYVAGVSPAGRRSDPVPALKAAFAQRPRAVFLLSDGDFSDTGAVGSALRTMNQDKKVEIHTIAFAPKDERKWSDSGLQNIAARNKGRFRRVLPADAVGRNAPDEGEAPPGPSGRVFGDGGRARTVTFVCDASGSMISVFGSLCNELAKAVDGLQESQSFRVLFFKDGKYVAFDEGRMVRADEKNKRKFRGWIVDVTATGTADPLPALEFALRDAPDLLYFATDGWFPNDADVVDTVKRLNARRKTRVNAVALLADGIKADRRLLDLLEGLSSDSGGRGIVVDEEALE